MVSDTINYFEARFCFVDERWIGLSKWAHFRQGERVYDFLLDDQDRILAQQGLNLSEGSWKVYLHGTENQDGVPVTRITTSAAELQVLPSDILEGEPLPPLPPTAAEQIEALAHEAKSIAEQVRDELNSGEVPGGAAAFIRSVKGPELILDHAADRALHGLKVYGRSTQQENPKPANPQLIPGLSPVILELCSQGLQSCQSLELPAAWPLAGIPVTDPALASYEDESGQLWCADELDFSRGVYVQRIGMIPQYSGEAINTEFLSSTGSLEVGAAVQYRLNEPLEIPLDPQLQEAYSKLKTFSPGSVLKNSKSAWMVADYVLESSKYIAPLKPTLRVSLSIKEGEIIVVKGQTRLSKGYRGTAVEFELDDYGLWAVTAVAADGSAVDVQVNVDSCRIYEIAVSGFECIFGAEWEGTAGTKWIRTDSAADFTDPIPYYAGMTVQPSSPFDHYAPWNQIRRVFDETAGELVEIPKYWYKWTRDGAKMKLQISAEKTEGFHVSPAHADRGDGQGERDVVYVGRYHCGPDYCSVSGASPKVSITRATARSGIHALGGEIWQYDYAMYWTIAMLYLVEYADWNIQKTIGNGCGNGSSIEAVGKSDTIPYHSGTCESARTSYGAGCQYRWIEGLWDNAYNFCDGIRLVKEAVYVIKNPADFSDTEGGVYVGDRTMSAGYLKGFTNPTESGYEYALFPSEVGGSDVTYIPDQATGSFGDDSVLIHIGGGGTWLNQANGLFYVASNRAGYITTTTSCRLMKLPNKDEVSK